MLLLLAWKRDAIFILIFPWLRCKSCPLIFNIIPCNSRPKLWIKLWMNNIFRNYVIRHWHIQALWETGILVWALKLWSQKNTSQVFFFSCISAKNSFKGERKKFFQKQLTYFLCDNIWSENFLARVSQKFEYV